MLFTYNYSAARSYINEVINFLMENAQFDDNKHEWDRHITVLYQVNSLLNALDHLEQVKQPED